GPLTGEATSIEQSALLGSLEAPFFTDRQRLETLFLATLSRPPTESERERLMPIITSSADAAERQRRLSDIVWAIFNGAEYSLNH
ncbi:MAG: hypothetical protein KDB14_16350, partial [Planctomycetales bacterium]|nr:hypothetical protein [Planctomycetales bacterium]